MEDLELVQPMNLLRARALRLDVPLRLDEFGWQLYRGTRNHAGPLVEDGT